MVWLKLITTAIIPITVLVFCNTKIFYEVRKNRLEMLAAKQMASPIAHQLNHQQENGSHQHHTAGQKIKKSPDKKTHEIKYINFFS